MLGIIAGIEGLAGVKPAAEDVVRPPHPGEDEAGPADRPFHGRGNLAAEEAAVREAVTRCYILRNLVEINVLEDIAGHISRLVRSGKVRNVHDLPVGISARPGLHGAGRSTAYTSVAVANSERKRRSFSK